MSVGVFVAVMVSVALSAAQSSAKENDCADEAEGIVDCEKGGSGDSGGGGGGATPQALTLTKGTR